jgi:hypothetical protein
MRLLTILAVLGFSVLFIPQNANAQAIDEDMLVTDKFCTTPRPAEQIAPNDKRWKYCDIHMRQFLYRDEFKTLQERLTTRAENFKASTKPVHDNYKAELQKYHDSLGSDD